MQKCKRIKVASDVIILLYYFYMIFNLKVEFISFLFTRFFLRNFLILYLVLLNCIRCTSIHLKTNCISMEDAKRVRVETGAHSGSALNDAHGTSLDRALRRNKREEREKERHIMLRPFNNGVSAVIFGTYLECVCRSWRTCSGPLNMFARFVGTNTRD